MSDEPALKSRIFIDPAWGKPPAFATFYGHTLVSWGRDANPKSLCARIDVCDEVYCEDQFAGKSYESVKKLIRSAGWIEFASMLCDKPFYLINPAKWKSVMGLYRKTAGTKHKIALVRWEGVALLSHLGNVKDPTVDELDAILMGQCFVSGWVEAKKP